MIYLVGILALVLGFIIGMAIKNPAYQLALAEKKKAEIALEKLQDENERNFEMLRAENEKINPCDNGIHDFESIYNETKEPQPLTPEILSELVHFDPDYYGSEFVLGVLKSTIKETSVYIGDVCSRCGKKVVFSDNDLKVKVTESTESVHTVPLVPLVPSIQQKTRSCSTCKHIDVSEDIKPCSECIAIEDLGRESNALWEQG